jgi:signal transduction histidine kinase
MQALLCEPDIQAVATVPLHSKNRLLGSLNLGRLKPRPFSAEDLSVMEPAARHLATALDNARLMQAVWRRGQEFGSLLEIGRAILERLELRELLPLVTRSVNELMRTSYCILLLRSEDRLVVGAQEGLEPEIIELVNGMRVGESLSGWVADRGETLAIPDMGSDSRLKYRAVVEQHGYRSFLCVPLRRGSEVLGTLEVVTKDQRAFGQEEQELMSAFADQAAIAIDHARLFEQTRSNLEHLEEANRMLEELDRMRRQYLRNVSHEFRTPLTVIRGYAEFLRDTDPPSQASLKHVMKVMIESCDRVIDLVDTLLEVSRVEQEMASDTLRVQDLRLEDLVGQSVERLQSTADKRNISLSVEYSGSPLSLQGDHGLLLQVVRKLLDNAVKYSPEGSRVVVRGLAEGKSLSLQVQDDGIGISSEHLGRIFDKFYMVDGGIARQVGGTGVGLYLVREIVKLHKGAVDVRSRPGEGSLFSVTLPREFQGTRPPVLTS